MIAMRYTSCKDEAFIEETFLFDLFDTIKNKLMDGVLSKANKNIVHVCFVVAIKKWGLDIVNMLSML